MTTPISGMPHVVALGGGHGLAATLRAARRLTSNITAVVGVSDDGGSSGRLRRDFGCIPPGDLRMALAALCGDDVSGETWARVVQHRFGGRGDLAGHALGNLLITALWEETGDIVAGLDWVASLLGAKGRVLPLATRPLDLVAEVVAADGSAAASVHGQVAIARTEGRVREVTLVPESLPATPSALEAVLTADSVIMGPGSWYTSVLPHLLLPDMRRALASTSATRICVLNLVPQAGETSHFEPHTHLDVLAQAAPEMRFDIVVADRGSVDDVTALTAAASRLGARLQLADVADPLSPGRHHPDRLAVALHRALGAQ